jgi:uncharacterized protein (TIGR02996 family)
MTDEQRFLETIRQNPDDDAPRLVYADWLEEHGDPDRAEFIRIDIELDRIHKKGGQGDQQGESNKHLYQRHRELREEHLEEWLQPVAGLHEHDWDRGFLSCIHVSPEPFLEVAEEVFRRHPAIDVLGLHGLSSEDLKRVVRLPYLGQLGLLELHSEGIKAGEWVPLLASPLTRLVSLSLWGNQLNTADVTALGGNSTLAGLKWIKLQDTGIGDVEARILVESPHLGSLKSLEVGQLQSFGNVSRNTITTEGLRLLRQRFGKGVEA